MRLHREDLPATTARLRSGEPVTLRLMRPEDAGAFGDYLEGLSEDTRRRWGPHPHDRPTAESICASLDPDDIARFVITLDEGSGSRIIAYLLLKLPVLDGDRDRYHRLAIELDPAVTASLAPSVADDHQDQGVGGLLMEYAVNSARLLGMKRIVLWGGVQATNARAIRYYVRSGFRKVGEFFNDKNNHDMFLDLPPVG